MTAPASPAIRVFEPALCCNTGVCGPDVDQALVTFTADLDHVRGLGVDIERHNLANDPAAFAAQPAVRDFLKVAGSAGLPLTLVDGVTVATGSYPSRGRLLQLPRHDHRLARRRSQRARLQRRVLRWRRLLLTRPHGIRQNGGGERGGDVPG